MQVKRILGPDEHGREKFRVRIVRSDGAIGTHYFVQQVPAPEYRSEGVEYHKGDRSTAERFVASLKKEISDRTIGMTITDYLDHLVKYGGDKRTPIKANTVPTTRSKLVMFFQLCKPYSVRRGTKRSNDTQYDDRPLSSLTPSVCQKLYNDLVKTKAAATHHGMLKTTQNFTKWCTASGFFKKDPAEEILLEGTANVGKAQLKLDEARKLILQCYSDSHPTAGVAVAAVLTLGARAHEITERQVNDLDDNGKVLCITKSKTKAGERRVQLPPVLRAKLRKVVEGQPPGASIFSMSNANLLEHVYRLCHEAGVPAVCTHGLRGTHVTLTGENEIEMQNIARQVGHAGTDVTRRHYMAAGTEQSMRAARFEAMLLQAPDESDADEQLERELREAEARVAALKLKRAAPQVNKELGSASPTVIPHLKIVS